MDKPSSATIRDVARQAGVSVATVSRFLNQNAHLAPDTQARVVAAIHDLDYVPETAARNLSNRKTNAIGLLLPGIVWDHFFPPMLRGVEAACYDAGFDLLISSTHQPNPRGGRSPLGEHNTDGLLLFTGSVAVDDVLRLWQKGHPLVLLYSGAPGSLPVPHVVFENKEGSRQIVSHLIEQHGFTKIGFLAGPADNEDARWRERGYREALAAHGLPYRPEWVRQGEFDEEIAYRTVRDWLAAGLDVEAIFAADDDSAYGAVRALNEAGRRIPEEVALVGFDDSPTSRLLLPPLTTVRAPIEESGYRAASLLAELIRGGAAQTEILLPTEIVIRRSCGCHPNNTTQPIASF
ncbi:MAG TPA: LacI family DNA-binding transcriptional regulator [Anaerolineaceae bacterium]